MNMDMKQFERQGEIYIHVPFCVRKCAYCDFFSGAFSEEQEDQYFQALLSEIRETPYAEGFPEIRSIFIGGGTPSKVAPGYIAEILKAVRERFTINTESEITIECNPGTLTEEKLIAYKEAGINRLSIGLQSADDGLLKTLGRIHTYKDFLKNYESARKAGFGNISVDLMSGLPGQNMKQLETTLKTICELEPEHISCYSLIIEEGTPFFKQYGERRDLFPTEEEDRKMYHRTREILASNGYLRYEVSNYAKPGFESKHNTGYWTGLPYLGFGAAAASYIPEFQTKSVNARRFKNSNSLTYRELPLEEEEILDQEDLMAEFMFLGLRMTEGVDNRIFRERFGCSFFEHYREIIDKYVRQGALEIRGENLRLTDFGQDVENVVLCEFV